MLLSIWSMRLPEFKRREQGGNFARACSAAKLSRFTRTMVCHPSRERAARERAHARPPMASIGMPASLKARITPICAKAARRRRSKTAHRRAVKRRAVFEVGWSRSNMVRVNREAWPRCKPERNYTLPLVALNSGKRMDQMLRSMFGDSQIETCALNFFACRRT